MVVEFAAGKPLIEVDHWLARVIGDTGLRSCLAEPGIVQGSNEGFYPSAIRPPNEVVKDQ